MIRPAYPGALGRWPAWACASSTISGGHQGTATIIIMLPPAERAHERGAAAFEPGILQSFGPDRKGAWNWQNPIPSSCAPVPINRGGRSDSAVVDGPQAVICRR